MTEGKENDVGSAEAIIEVAPKTRTKRKRNPQVMNESNEKEKGADFIDLSNSNAEPSTCPTKRKKNSVAWKEFDEIEEGGKVKKAKCKHCLKVMGGERKNGTSNMLKHLKRCEIYMQKQRQINQMYLKVDEKGDGAINTYCFKFNQDVTRECIAQMIILHELPFSMVHYVGFRRLLSSMQPTFKLVTRNTIKGDCMKIYETEKKSLYESLGRNKNRISLTSNFWTSGQNIGYMSLTAHYIDEEWKIQKRILCFCTLSNRHTGENIAKLLLDKMYEWNIDRKLCSITLDNCSTNDVVVRELLRKLQPKKVLLLDGKLFQVRCSAHILNLIVQDGLKEIEAVIKKIRDSVKFIRSSPQRQRKFEGVCLQVGAPQKKLVQDVPTRWNSTYMMLATALEFRGAFARYAEMEQEFKCNPEDKDWINAQSLSNCLKVFYEATILFSGSRYVTINRYFGIACSIYIQLFEWCRNEDTFIISMALKMKEKFEKHWNITSMSFAIASVLDPRFKMKLVNYYFPKIYGENYEGKMLEIQNTLTSLYNEYAANHSTSSFVNNDVNETSMLADDDNGVGGSSESAFASTLRGFASFLEETSENTTPQTELEEYLNGVNHPVKKGKDLHDESFDILGWWKVNTPKYPIMGMMACDILAIPASTVASESAFSTGGRVINRYRSTMRPQTIEALICAQDWIRNGLDSDGYAKDNSAFENVQKAFDEVPIDEVEEFIAEEDHMATIDDFVDRVVTLD